MNKLQSRIDKCNLIYRQKKLAIVNFQETPIIQTKTGLVRKLSTVDYIGIYTDGHGVAFDAKECKSLTSIPLHNFKQHQVLFLEYWDNVGGNAFFLVHFYNLYKDKAFMVPVMLVSSYINKNNRKSIPIGDFKDEWLVPIDDYLQLLI